MGFLLLRKLIQRPPNFFSKWDVAAGRVANLILKRRKK